MLNDANHQDRQESEDEVDVISHSIGEYGRWQFYLTFLLSLVNIPCTWHIFVPTFHDAYKEFWCARTNDFANVDPVRWRNYTQPVGPCQIFNLSYLDGKTNLEEIQNIHGVHLVNCENWEFEGEGGFFNKKKVFVNDPILLQCQNCVVFITHTYCTSNSVH